MASSLGRDLDALGAMLQRARLHAATGGPDEDEADRALARRVESLPAQTLASSPTLFRAVAAEVGPREPRVLAHALDLVGGPPEMSGRTLAALATAIVDSLDTQPAVADALRRLGESPDPTRGATGRERAEAELEQPESSADLPAADAVSGRPNFTWVGTGFLVAADLVMTNRHVAAEFGRRDGSRWTFSGGRGASPDLLEEMGGTGEWEFTVTDLVCVHEDDDVDLALLRVERTGTAGEAELPPPLPLAAVPPPDLVGRQVYVVRHDCSTLGGNSGSPGFDLADHRVIGLHFGGRYGEGNVAVPLWRLVRDPLVAAAAGLNFVA